MSNMRVKIKSKEPTAVEKRNTSMIHFVLVALFPVLLCLYLGFNMGHVEEVNNQNLIKKLEELSIKHSTLTKNLEALNVTFLTADTTLERYSKGVFKSLAREVEGIERESAFKYWDNDRTDFIDDFKHYINKVERPLDFKKEKQLNTLLEYGKKWMTAYADLKNDELIEMKLRRKQDLGFEINTDLEQQIQELRTQLSEKNNQISILEKDLQLIGTLKDRDLSDVEKELVQCRTDLQNLTSGYEEKVTGQTDKIFAELDEIRTQLLNLKGQKFFNLKKDEDKVRKLKEAIENKLNAIQRHAESLK